jgi:hypothetical protein
VRERQRSESPEPAPLIGEAAAVLPDVAGVLALQRTAGNRSVTAMLLARQAVAEPLPPIADGLRRARAGLPRLRALAAREAPVLPTDGFVDIRPALEWLRELVATLTLVEPIVDPSMLVFESVVVTGHDAEYGSAGAEIRPAVAAALKTVLPIATRLSTTITRVVMQQINRSSVGVEDRAAEPQLAALADVTAWREQSSALRALAGKVDRGGGLADAAHACEEAALALLQARSVLNARATWRADAAQSSTPAQIANPSRPRNEVDDIFADSGFAGRQSLRPNGTRDDWCGMFVAASMFRGAALDKNVRMAFAHTDNVRDFFSYSGRPINDSRTPLSIWAEGRWWRVREYHEQRGLPRRWVSGRGVQGADIRPGDVALIRHAGVQPDGEVANHIVMVDSWDPLTGRLVTVEGNVKEGIRPEAAGSAEPRRTASGDYASTTTRAPSSTAIHIRDMDDQVTLTPGGAGPGGVYRERGARTVWAVGRPSLVDFEHHEYGLQAIPSDLTYVSPEEMRLRGQRARLAPTSTRESPATGPYHRRAGG